MYSCSRAYNDWCVIAKVPSNKLFNDLSEYLTLVDNIELYMYNCNLLAVPSICNYTAYMHFCFCIALLFLKTVFNFSYMFIIGRFNRLRIKYRFFLLLNVLIQVLLLDYHPLNTSAVSGHTSVHQAKSLEHFFWIHEKNGIFFISCYNNAMTYYDTTLYDSVTMILANMRLTGNNKYQYVGYLDKTWKFSIFSWTHKNVSNFWPRLYSVHNCTCIPHVRYMRDRAYTGI